MSAMVVGVPRDAEAVEDAVGNIVATELLVMFQGNPTEAEPHSAKRRRTLSQDWGSPRQGFSN